MTTQPHDTTDDPSTSAEVYAGLYLTHCTAPGCGATLATHVGGKPCVVGTRPAATQLHDLPIARWAWRGDGRDRNA